MVAPRMRPAVPVRLRPAVPVRLRPVVYCPLSAMPVLTVNVSIACTRNAIS